MEAPVRPQGAEEMRLRGRQPMQQWYLAKGKQRLGPFTSTQLQEMATHGDLQPSDVVLLQGAQKWIAASSVKGLFSAKLSKVDICESVRGPAKVRRNNPSLATPSEGAWRKRSLHTFLWRVTLLLLFLAGGAAGWFYWETAVLRQ